MTPPRSTELAHTLLRTVIREGDTVIDATAGNGHDTLFLAGCVGPGGRVLAFDVQENAIRSAHSKLERACMASRVEFHHACHTRIGEHAAAGTVSAVMFNLGYLPGEDHGLTTETQETLLAIGSAVELLRPGGALSVVCYPGHSAGADEASAVEKWMSSLASVGFRVAKYGMVGTLRPAPFLLHACKP